MIIHITNETFASMKKLKHLFLSANRLENIPCRAFYNLDGFYLTRVVLQEIIMLSDNPIKTIGREVFRFARADLRIYLLRTKLKMLSLESFIGIRGLNYQL
ncbi:uncharacterized protein LOC144659888 [Oculina patagonica]